MNKNKELILCALSLLIISTALAVPPTPTKRSNVFARPASVYRPKLALLCWDYYTNDPGNIVFIVYHTYNINSTNWQAIGQTSATYYPIWMQNTNEFFRVTASNVITHLESK